MPIIEATQRQRHRRTGINRLLHAIYDSDRLLSQILSDGGMSQGEINLLQRQHLEPYLEALLGRWCSWFDEILPNRRAEIIIRRYSLDGRAKPTLQQLAGEYGISRERIRQLEKGGVRRLRSRDRRSRLENLACGAAREILSRPGQRRKE